MNYFHRARKSMNRKKGKSLILLVLVFLLGTMLFGAISLRNAVIQTEAGIKRRLPTVATLTWDAIGAGHSFQSNFPWEFPTVEMIESVGALPYVQQFEARGSHILGSHDLHWVSSPIDEELVPMGTTLEILELNQQGFKEDTFGGYEMFHTMGINYALPADAAAGAISLVAGRFMTQEEIDQGAPVALVSRLFAEHNNLDIGSRITLENHAYEVESDCHGCMATAVHHMATETYELEIVGMFEVLIDFMFPDDAFRTTLYVNIETALQNQIYIPHRLQIQQIQFLQEHTTNYFFENHADAPVPMEAMFLMHDPRDFDAFYEAAVRVLPDHWSVVDTSQAIRPMIGALDNLLYIANLIFLGASAATLIILNLLILFFLRDRKQELGIYLALGEQKSKIIGQLLIEVLAVATIGLFFAFFAGNRLSQSLSQQMFQQQIIEQINNTPMLGDHVPWELRLFDPGPMTMEEMLAAYDTSLATGQAVLFFAIQFIVIFISVLIPILATTRLNPKKILM